MSPIFGAAANPKSSDKVCGITVKTDSILAIALRGGINHTPSQLYIAPQNKPHVQFPAKLSRGDENPSLKCSPAKKPPEKQEFINKFNFVLMLASRRRRRRRRKRCDNLTVEELSPRKKLEQGPQTAAKMNDEVL